MNNAKYYEVIILTEHAYVEGRHDAWHHVYTDIDPATVGITGGHENIECATEGYTVERTIWVLPVKSSVCSENVIRAMKKQRRRIWDLEDERTTATIALTAESLKRNVA